MDDTDLTAFIRAQRSEVAKSKAPLKDVRVIDFGSVVAAPFAATVLGDYGVIGRLGDWERCHPPPDHLSPSVLGVLRRPRGHYPSGRVTAP
jgi:hypothetical protein